jgi:hypothetical protein
MHAYWLGIFALVVAIALAAWITLVLQADRKPPDKPQEEPPHREIVGGIFQASRGGRQLMPDPNEPIVHDVGVGGAEQPAPEQRSGGSDAPAPVSTARNERAPEAKVPEQRKGGLPEQAQASRDRT